jgi:hypothetical protein
MKERGGDVLFSGRLFDPKTISNKKKVGCILQDL